MPTIRRRTAAHRASRPGPKTGSRHRFSWRSFTVEQIDASTLEDDRKTLLKRYLTEDPAVLAADLGLPLRALRQRITRARAALMREMESGDTR